MLFFRMGLKCDCYYIIIGLVGTHIYFQITSWRFFMEVCSVCGSTDIYKSVEGKCICKICYKKLSMMEACDVSYEEWMVSIINFNQQENGVDIVINRVLAEIDDGLCINERIELLLKDMKEKIYLHLKYYSRNEVYIAALTIRETIRRLLLKVKDKLDWAIINDISATNILLKAASDITEDEYENNPIGSLENGASNFITAICLARRYNLIEENCKLIKNKDISLKDVCYSAVETEEINQYFSRLLLNGSSEKVEDYIINNEMLKDKLEKEGKTPEYILKDINALIKKEFGFELEDCNNICAQLMRFEFPTKNDYASYFKCDKLFIDAPLMILERSQLEQICGQENLEAILNTFSINRNISAHQNSQEIELFSLYERDDLIVVGNFDFEQNISAFEKFILSKDYVDIFKKSEELEKRLTKIQKKMSKYVAISVADYLYSKGYKLPMEKYNRQMIPRAEIDKIKINGKQLLADCGDIDVLALDIEKKIVFLFEIKYYKPAISSYEMLYKDKSRIEEDEVLRKMQKREEVVLDNIDEVVKYVLKNYESGYKVKSIFLTPRTNYYAINEKKLNYLTWAEFTDKAGRKEL